MKTLVITGYFGAEHGKMAEYTAPLMLRYANRYGAAFECRHLSGPRPPSWLKVPAIYNALDSFDAVLWLDADVVIADSTSSIFDEVDVAAKAHALVEHKTECGLVPNCGVWLVTKLMRPWLQEIWSEGRNTNHPWWEQASILEKMGYEVSGASAAPGDRTSLLDATAFLGQEWNHHPRDERRCEINAAKFIHVTQYKNRQQAVENLAWSAR